MNQEINQVRKKISMFFVFFLGILVLLFSFLVIFLISQTIQEKAKKELGESVKNLIGEYSSGEIKDEVKQVYQQSNIQDSFSNSNKTLSNIKEKISENTIAKAEKKSFQKENLTQKNQDSENKANEEIVFEKDFQDLSNSQALNLKKNEGIYSRIIKSNGDILYSSSLFETIGLYTEKVGFLEIYEKDICIYYFGEKILTGTKKGDMVQTAKYCPFDKSDQINLFQKIFLVLIFVLIISYFIASNIALILLKPLIFLIEQTKKFTQNVYHEILTPVSVALTTLGASQKTQNYKEGIFSLKEDLESIQKTLQFLSKDIFLEQAKNFSEKINLAIILEKIIFEYSQQFEEKNLKLNLNIQKNVFFKANEVSLKIIFKNLILNSLKYSLNGSNVFLALEKNFFIIKNQTKNIEEIDEKKIFERYYRGKTQENIDGNGLGLSIVKELCDAYNLKITFEKEKDFFVIKIFF